MCEYSTSTIPELTLQVKDYEQRNLLQEVRMPLTVSSSRFYIIGVNPYSNFAITVKLCKLNKEHEAFIFTETEFNELMHIIPDILNGKNNREEYDISNYFITILPFNKTLVKFTNKESGKYDIFQKLTLENLLRLRSFHIHLAEKYTDLRLSDTFNSILEDLVEVIHNNNVDNYYDTKMFTNFIETPPKYNNHLVYLELVNKFNYFVYTSIGSKLKACFNRYYN
ncbi:unnamed protein product [Brassicogethes aeneus]|uniref:Uncharacterized protein n=1 Tax=Brassicogethes aeneus TaxID=1431903 RepID=A0A9P0B7A1_BRAAE|nr:unnamed protein product [Brassicogethes aeneus]